MGMPHFHSENSAEFCVWCTMAHWQGFASVYTARIDMLCSNCDELKPFKASSMLMRVAYMGKLMSLDDMDQDNHNREHNIA